MFKSGLLLSVLLSIQLFVSAGAQTLCFASASSGNVIRLQLTLPAEGSRVAYLHYERGEKRIPLIRIHEEVVASSRRGPATVKTVFSEHVKGEQTGKYMLTTQGGVVGDLVYVRQRSKKAFTFYEDQEATTSDGCLWLRKVIPTN